MNPIFQRAQQEQKFHSFSVFKPCALCHSLWLACLKFVGQLECQWLARLYEQVQRTGSARGDSALRWEGGNMGKPHLPLCSLLSSSQLHAPGWAQGVEGDPPRAHRCLSNFSRNLAPWPDQSPATRPGTAAGNPQPLLSGGAWC